MAYVPKIRCSVFCPLQKYSKVSFYSISKVKRKSKCDVRARYRCSRRVIETTYKIKFHAPGIYVNTKTLKVELTTNTINKNV